MIRTLLAMHILVATKTFEQDICRSSNNELNIKLSLIAESFDTSSIGCQGLLEGLKPDAIN